MPEKVKAYEPPAAEDCYVLVLDVLGTRRFLETKTPEELATLFGTALGKSVELREKKDVLVIEVKADPLYEREFMDDYVTGIESLIPTRPDVVAVYHHYKNIRQPVVFSGSVFVFTTDATARSLQEILEFGNALFRVFLLSLLPSAGVIARGACVVDYEAGVFVGPGIVRAHELEQRLSLVGVVAHPNVPDHEQLTRPIRLTARRRGLWPIRTRVSVRAALASKASEKVVQLPAEVLPQVEEQAEARARRRFRDSRAVTSAMLAAAPTPQVGPRRPDEILREPDLSRLWRRTPKP